jgi:hypothetical protein
MEANISPNAPFPQVKEEIIHGHLRRKRGMMDHISPWAFNCG